MFNELHKVMIHVKGVLMVSHIFIIISIIIMKCIQCVYMYVYNIRYNYDPIWENHTCGT